MKRVISKDGTAIAYDQTGQGPALILVGGAMSYRSFPGFVKLAGLLATDYTVINYDRRGRGNSGDTHSYAVAREVEDLQAVIDGAGGGSAYVWGMSSGAALALDAAASGLNITKLALYEPPFMVGDNPPAPPADHEEQLRKMIAANRRDDAVKFFLRNMGAPGIAIAIMRVMPFWARFRAVAHTLPYDAAVMGDYSLPAKRIASVNVPTLVIGGEKSQAVLRQAVQEVASILPNGESLMLKDQTHNVSMKVLAPALKSYFSR
ncbi:alpha/beta fold hydrolase [Paenibacillus beijingensis]|uniref:Hydrolase n=1 Tax=Paenibacillus beijingensis TaxID=1126833 RepID=A0A0D5NED4_9BACL|nr:alpha/beta hydrolase [Paenibacillus beijingensis]AJY73520.1 hydrolase [Paenibacillus beijingensis]